MYSRSTPVSSQGRHTNNHNDFFPLLSSQEITVCLQSCNINVTQENLAKPTSSFTQHLFIDLIPPEFLPSVLERKLEKFHSKNLDSDELMGDISQSLSIIALQRELYDFMKVCGIDDFNFLDIYKPDAYRLARILSGVVNFARFKYERSNDYQKLIDISEAQLVKRNSLIDENQQLANDIVFLQSKHGRDAKAKLAEINEYQSKIQRDLKELKSIQDKLSQEHANYKRKRNDLIAEIESQNEQIINATKENEEVTTLMQKIDVRNPENSKNEIIEYKKELSKLKIQLTDLDDKTRKLQITIDSMKLVGIDIESLLNLANTIKTDLKASKDQEIKLTKYNDAKDFKNSELQNLNKKIQQIQQQIDNVNEKISRYTSQRAEKSEKNRAQMAKLQEEYTKLMSEKKIRDKKLGDKGTQLAEIEYRIKRTTTEFEEELRETELNIELLWNHIEGYMKRMEMEMEQGSTEQ